MRHVETVPGPEYVFVGGRSHKAPDTVAPEAYKTLLKMSANQLIGEEWEKVLNNATEEALCKKLAEFGMNGDVVYTSQLRDDGIANLCFYAGPPRKKI